MSIIGLFQGENDQIELEKDIVTSSELEERYKLLASNKSEIQKRDTQQKISTIELAIFTDRLEEENKESFLKDVSGRCMSMSVNVIQTSEMKGRSRIL